MTRSCLISLIIGLSAVCWGPLPVRAAGETPRAITPIVSATGVQVESRGDVTRITFALSGPVEATGFVLADPDRVIVDLPEVDFQIDPSLGRASPARPATIHSRRPGRDAKPAGGLVGSFRFGLFAPGKSRVVVDLAEPARLQRVATETDAASTRLVIELAKADRAAFLAQARKSARAPEPLAPALQYQPNGLSGLPVIAIDPGHGGVDVGARSSDGTQEKDIVFAFAQTLGERLEASGRFRVVMTRTSDIFVPLSERVRIARAAGASLLVSIHADMLAEEANVSGATVYTVSDKASDAEAARVADSENKADAAAGVDGREDQSDVSDILADLTRRETRAYSHVFARTLVGYWKDVARLNKNPERSAGFRVLKAPDVPSVLVELGYLSSERDLAALVTAAWREKAAGSVARAVDQFFRSRGLAGQVLGGEDQPSGQELGLRPGSSGVDNGSVAASIR